jgi:hypothetical protein
MTAESDESASIGPKLSLDEVELPPAVGERLATLYRREHAPDTAAEWVALIREAVADLEGREPTLADLCTAPDGDHAFEGGGERQSYVCVLDPVAYAFVTGTPGTVRSETPVRGETVRFEIGEDGLDVSHDDAVVSIGVSDYVDDVGEPTLETTYRQVCGYIQTFADETAYEAWAADVEAATTALSAREGVAVGRELATALFGRAERPTEVSPDQ